jgi:hypothetical protein
MRDKISRRFRKFLVTGAARSGTMYTAKLLEALGLDVGHESSGADGIVSWYLAADTDWVPKGPTSLEVTFEHVFHQVRHPLSVIPSMATLRPDTWSFVVRHTPCSLGDPLLLRCAKFWLSWNEMAEMKAEWRYRVEDVPLIYKEFCEKFCVGCDWRVLDQLPRDINTRPPRLRTWIYRLDARDYCRYGLLRPVRNLLLHMGGAARKPTLTWNYLDHVDFSLSQRIRQKAREYGYDD